MQATNLPFQINCLGSMISLHFTEDPVIDFLSAQKGDNISLKIIFMECFQWVFIFLLVLMKVIF